LGNLVEFGSVELALFAIQVFHYVYGNANFWKTSQLLSQSQTAFPAGVILSSLTEKPRFAASDMVFLLLLQSLCGNTCLPSMLCPAYTTKYIS